MNKKMVAGALSLALLGAGCGAPKPTDSSFVRQVRARDDTHYYDEVDSKKINLWGDFVCQELKTKSVPVVLFNIQSDIPARSWGVLVGTAVTEKC